MMDARQIWRQFDDYIGRSLGAYDPFATTKRRIKPTDAMRPKGLAAKRKARRKMAHESRRRNRWK